MKFEYDPNKSKQNQLKHGLDFEEAQELWQDSNRVEIGYQLKAKTLIQRGSQPARVSADLTVHFIPPYVGSRNFISFDPVYFSVSQGK